MERLQLTYLISQTLLILFKDMMEMRCNQSLIAKYFSTFGLTLSDMEGREKKRKRELEISLYLSYCNAVLVTKRFLGVL